MRLITLKTIKLNTMSTPFIDKNWWVVTEGNEMLLYTPKGELVHGQITMRVTENLGERPTALMKCIVNLAGSREEMMRKIEELSK
jgi:hypothetical protein